MKFFNIFGNTPWSIADLNPPWGSRPSIYWHIFNNLDDDSGSLIKSELELPDEMIVRGDASFSWAAGALDGAFGHHGAGSEDVEKAGEIVAALRNLSEKVTDKNATALYAAFTNDHALSLVDPMLEAIVSAQNINSERVETIALWLAMNAPDREPVKFALAILGLFPGPENREIIMTLGKHEEFTLYAAVALSNTQNDSENALWQLAQHVRGWGRIHIVERLAETEDPYIKDWLLREGYRNEIMYEYTALICAQAGGLHNVLQDPDIDDELLRGAGDIISALLDFGGPAAGMESYEKGAEVTENYLKNLIPRDNDLGALVNAIAIRQFLDNPENGVNTLAEPLSQDWNSRREPMLKMIGRIKTKPGWREKIEAGLKAEDNAEFGIATEAAKTLEIDVWDYYFGRIKAGNDHFWWQAFQTDIPSRIDELIEYAEQTFPLEEIATGPGNEIGLGKGWASNFTLSIIVQMLEKHPGKGWPLIKTALRSPVVRDRNAALNTLAGWGKHVWTAEVESILKKALEIEPDDNVRGRLNELLA